VGRVPHSFGGHSSGEISAAYAAQLLTLEDATKVAFFRGEAASDMANRRGGSSSGSNPIYSTFMMGDGWL
jgi:malonyl CoA-acyl carrier protein transacylase